MARAKLYFEEGNWEACYPLSHYRELIRLGMYSEIRLIQAVIDFGGDGAWCKQMGEVFERGDSPCGTQCHLYEPRNNKNGICRHQTFCYRETELKFVLTKEGLKPLEVKLCNI